MAQYYGFDTHIKEDSAAYLKSWLQNLKEDAKLLKRKFRFEKSFEFDNFSICIPQEKFSEVISYLALNGFRVAVKTRVPD